MRRESSAHFAGAIRWHRRSADPRPTLCDPRDGRDGRLGGGNQTGRRARGCRRYRCAFALRKAVIRCEVEARPWSDALRRFTLIENGRPGSMSVMGMLRHLMFKIDQFSPVDCRSIWNCRMFNAHEASSHGLKSQSTGDSYEE